MRFVKCGKNGTWVFAQTRGCGWITLAQECSIVGETMRFLFA